jgi:hypothetical protein
MITVRFTLGWVRARPGTWAWAGTRAGARAGTRAGTRAWTTGRWARAWAGAGAGAWAWAWARAGTTWASCHYFFDIWSSYLFLHWN